MLTCDLTAVAASQAPAATSVGVCKALSAATPMQLPGPKAGLFAAPC